VRTSIFRGRGKIRRGVSEEDRIRKRNLAPYFLLPLLLAIFAIPLFLGVLGAPKPSETAALAGTRVTEIEPIGAVGEESVPVRYIIVPAEAPAPAGVAGAGGQQQQQSVVVVVPSLNIDRVVEIEPTCTQSDWCSSKISCGFC
jgi:hypothetical protein